MPFSLSVAPRIIPKLMSLVISKIMLKGFSIDAYMDDLLVWAAAAALGILRHLGMDHQIGELCSVV